MHAVEWNQHDSDWGSNPKYIKESLLSLNETQFGYDAFGLKNNTDRKIKEYIISYKNKFLDSLNF